MPYMVFFSELKYLNSFIAKLNKTWETVSMFLLARKALFQLPSLIAQKVRESGENGFHC